MLFWISMKLHLFFISFETTFVASLSSLSWLLSDDRHSNGRLSCRKRVVYVWIGYYSLGTVLFIRLRQTAVPPPRRPFFYCFLLPFDCNNHLFLEGSFLEAVTVSTWILDITFHFHSAGKVWWLSKEDMGQTRVHLELEIISAWSYLLFLICLFLYILFFLQGSICFLT